MQAILEFKSDNLKSELEIIDSRLRCIIYALAGFMYYKFGKSLMITELLRTQEMQDEYYKDDPVYQAKKFVSVHQVGRGADLSLKYYTQPEINSVSEFLKQFIYVGKVNTFLIHDMGFGQHLHIQTDNYDFTRINKI